MGNDKPVSSYNYYLLKGKDVCNTFKRGEYNGLRCCRHLGHEGEHNYVIVRKVPIPSEAKRTQQKLFTELGTLYRTRANLLNIYDRADQEQKIIIHHSIDVITALIAANTKAMKNIPKPQPKSNSAV